jgi:hypothetical protein
VLLSSSTLISLELLRPSSALLYQMLSQAHRRGSSTEPRNLAISLPVSKLDSNTDRKSFVRAFHIKPFNARGVKDCTHGCQCSYKMRYIPSSKYLRTTDAAIPCLGGPCSRPMLTISTSHPQTFVTYSIRLGGLQLGFTTSGNQSCPCEEPAFTTARTLWPWLVHDSDTWNTRVAQQISS